METTAILDSLFRWVHVVAGILWIGLLFFFNWVNSAFAPTMDGDTKKKVVPELLPRTLYWFRWGAAFTWITGVILLIIVFYHGGLMFNAPQTWHPLAYVMLVIVFLGVYIYDILYKTVLKNPTVGFIVGWILASAAVYAFADLGHFGTRAYMIHLGAMFGTFMAFNVWYRIWPAQQKIITAIKNGETPDAALAGLAGTRSKHNTYMSVPLVFAMLNTHHITWATKPYILSLAILVGWLVVYWLYNKAKKVPGF